MLQFILEGPEHCFPPFMDGVCIIRVFLPIPQGLSHLVHSDHVQLTENKQNFLFQLTSARHYSTTMNKVKYSQLKAESRFSQQYS